MAFEIVMPVLQNFPDIKVTCANKVTYFSLLGPFGRALDKLTVKKTSTFFKKLRLLAVLLENSPTLHKLFIIL